MSESNNRFLQSNLTSNDLATETTLKQVVGGLELVDVSANVTNLVDCSCNVVNDVTVVTGIVDLDCNVTNMELDVNVTNTLLDCSCNIVNFPTTQNVSEQNINFANAMIALDTGDVEVTGDFYQTTQPVSGTFYQTTQPVSGAFYQTTQPVSGTFYQTTQPVSVAATLDVSEQNANFANAMTALDTGTVAVTGALTTTAIDSDYQTIFYTDFSKDNAIDKDYTHTAITGSNGVGFQSDGYYNTTGTTTSKQILYTNDLIDIHPNSITELICNCAITSRTLTGYSYIGLSDTVSDTTPAALNNAILFKGEEQVEAGTLHVTCVESGVVTNVITGGYTGSWVNNVSNRWSTLKISYYNGVSPWIEFYQMNTDGEFQLIHRIDNNISSTFNTLASHNYRFVVVKEKSAGAGGNNTDIKINSVLIRSSVFKDESGIVDHTNSSTALLANSATFTGEWINVSKYSEFTCLISTDKPGTLMMDLSTDAVNIDRTKTVLVRETGGHVSTLAVVSKYMRVRYTNGTSGAQTVMRLQTILHKYKSKNLTSTTSQVISDKDDCELIRLVNDPILDFARNVVSDKRVIHKFGRNPEVDDTWEDIWNNGGDITFLTSASTLEAISLDANDTVAGSGARTLTLEGLDDTGVEITETMDMNGTSATTATSSSFRRLDRCYVATCGTYGGTNYDNITVRVSGAGATLALITGAETTGTATYGYSHSQLSLYTVPLNFKAYLTRININIDGTKTATIALYKREDFLQTAGNRHPRRLVWKGDDIAGLSTVQFGSYIEFPELTDIWFRAKADANGTLIDVQMDLILIDQTTS